MRLLVAVGGGGHFAPALALIQSMRKRRNSVLLVGRKYSMEGDRAISFEYQSARKNKINFKQITSGRLQRRFTRYTLLSILKIPYGFVQSYLIIRKFKPEVVLSFGGYVSFPIAVCAFLMGIPIVVHEQTLEAGLSNRVVSLLAKKVCISWKSSRRFFQKSKIVRTGNPIRKFKIKSLKTALGKNHLEDKEFKEFPLLYITGGSLGSHVINEAVKESLIELLESFRIIHQTGDSRKYNDFDKLSFLRAGMPEGLKGRYFPTKFVDSAYVGSVLSDADLVVTRSGINTITELMYFGKPTIAIPLPHSQKDEQVKNANFLKETGLGEVISQKDLSGVSLKNKIFELLLRKNEYLVASAKAKEIIVQDSAQKIVDVLTDVISHDL